MTKNEDILKPFEVIERQTLEVENVVEKNKYFTILFFSQLYTQLDTCQKCHPDEFSNFIDSIGQKKEVIITGDFNIKLLKIHERELFSEFLDTLVAHSFIPKITFPTRFTQTTGTLIDNLFCKLTLQITDIKPGICIKQFSDHQPYFIVTNIVTTRVPQPKYIAIREQDDVSLAKVNTELMNSNLMTKMDLIG